MLFGMPDILIYLETVKNASNFVLIIFAAQGFLVLFAFIDLAWHSRTAIAQTMLKIMVSHHQWRSFWNFLWSHLMTWQSIWKYSSIGDQRLSFWTLHIVPWSSFLCVYIMFLELVCSHCWWKKLSVLLCISNFVLIIFPSDVYNS